MTVNIPMTDDCGVSFDRVTSYNARCVTLGAASASGHA